MLSLCPKPFHFTTGFRVPARARTMASEILNLVVIRRIVVVVAFMMCPGAVAISCATKNAACLCFELQPGPSTNPAGWTSALATASCPTLASQGVICHRTCTTPGFCPMSQSLGRSGLFSWVASVYGLCEPFVCLTFICFRHARRSPAAARPETCLSTGDRTASNSNPPRHTVRIRT